MPTTRAQGRLNEQMEGTADVGTGGDTARGRGTREASAPRRGRAARGRARARTRRSPVPLEEEDTFYEDDEVEKIKTLHTKDGKLGFFSENGFIFVTNFIVDIGSQVSSRNYSVKGK